MNDSFRSRLVQCLDCVTKEFVGILNVSSTDGSYDTLTTIPNEGASGTIPFTCGDVLTKPLFGTGNVGHTIFFKVSNIVLNTYSTLFFAKDKGAVRR